MISTHKPEKPLNMMPEKRPHDCAEWNRTGQGTAWIIYNGHSRRCELETIMGTITRIDFCPWCGERLNEPVKSATVHGTLAS